MHRLLRLLMWVAILSFAYHAVHWVVTTEVPLIEDKKQETSGEQQQADPEGGEAAPAPERKD